MEKRMFSGPLAWLRGMLAVALAVTVFPGAVHAQEGKATAAVAAPAISANISQEEAIAIARKLVSIPSGYKGPDVSIRNGSGSREETVWLVRWSQELEPYGYVRVEIDAETGAVLSIVNRERSDQTFSFPPKVSYEQAVRIASEWRDKLLPDQKRSYQYRFGKGNEYGKTLRHPGESYEIQFEALVNGIPFPEQTVSFEIDGNGQLISFYSDRKVRVDNFQEKAGILDEHEVLNRLSDQLRMKLAYSRKRATFDRSSGQQKPEMILAYVPDVTLNYLDPKTGSPIDLSGRPIVSFATEDKPLGTGKALQKQNKELTEKDALAIINGMIKLPEGVFIREIEKDMDTSQSSNGVWRVDLEYRGEHEEMIWTGATIDAATGKVLNLDLIEYLDELKNDNPPKKETYPVAEDKAKEAAIAFVAKQNPDRLHELYLSTPERKLLENQEPYYRYSFRRKVNGIEVQSDGVSVTISALTGEVVQYGEWWTDVSDFPDAKSVISPEKAKEIYLQEASVELEYRIARSDQKLPREQQKQSAILVYNLEQPWELPFYLDAATGKIMSFATGKEAERKSAEQAPVPADIEGHMAEKELLYLVQLNAIKVTDGKVEPNKAVTRGEFLDMFLRTIRHVPETYPYGLKESAFSDVPMEHPYYAVIQWAAERKWIEKTKTFAPDRPITREEAAQIIVNSLGHQELANLHHLYQLPFADHAQIAYKGHTAIANALGLVMADGRQFRPKAEVTRAEAALMFYRYLAKQAANPE